MRTLALLAFAVLPASAFAQTAPPPEWTCNAAFYAGGPADGCDCGCGAPDPDCADLTRASCEHNGCATADQVPTEPPTTCVANTCGDGYVAGAEVCDDGGGTGCAADCSAVDAGFACGSNAKGCHPTVCGDGIVDGAEECDDGVTPPAAGDGCSDTCTLEAGFNCPTPGQPCVAVPPAWVCDPTYFGSGDGCDCGCGVIDVDCVGGGCAEPGCDDGNVCAFCYDAAHNSVGCASAGEGEGEGEGQAGEGEGEGQGSGGRPDSPNPQAAGFVCGAAGSTAPVAALAVALVLAMRRRRGR